VRSETQEVGVEFNSLIDTKLLQIYYKY